MPIWVRMSSVSFMSSLPVVPCSKAMLQIWTRIKLSRDKPETVCYVFTHPVCDFDIAWPIPVLTKSCS